MDKVSGTGSAQPRGAIKRSPRVAGVDNKRTGAGTRQRAVRESQTAFANALRHSRQSASGVAEQSGSEFTQREDTATENLMSLAPVDPVVEAAVAVDDVSVAEEPATPPDSALSLLALQRTARDVFREPGQQDSPKPSIAAAERDGHSAGKSASARRAASDSDTTENAHKQAVLNNLASPVADNSTTAAPQAQTATRVADIEELANFFRHNTQLKLTKGDSWHVRVLNGMHGVEHLHIKMTPAGGWHVHVTMHESQLARSRLHLAQLRQGLRARGIELAEVELADQHEDDSQF